MSLLHVQRSPSPFPFDETESSADSEEWSEDSRRSRSLSECFFATRGAAVILPNYDGGSPSFSRGCEIESHLQLMYKLLRPQDTLSLAVRLQTQINDHVAYLSLVSVQDGSATRTVLLGMDYYEANMSIGVVMPLRVDSQVCLSGDGGVRVCTGGPFGRPEMSLLFRPVSVQTMWSEKQLIRVDKESWFVFQRLHRTVEDATRSDSPANGGCRLKAEASAVEHYAAKISSVDVLRSQWQQSPTEAEWAGELRAEGVRGRDGSETHAQLEIKRELQKVMQSVDLDAVTSRDIRVRLSQSVLFDIEPHKEFINRQMLVILGLMDKPSRIFDYLYLGTEWNASNLEELRQNNIGYILNMTQEVDNFFPNGFAYKKIPVADDAATDLLSYWVSTHNFIKEAKESGKSVLVHCKKGISRSSSTVIAYAMKEYGWQLEKALNHVKQRRQCITPNEGFMEQLKTFAGLLEASRNRQVFSQLPSTSSQVASAAEDVAVYRETATKASIVSVERSQSGCATASLADTALRLSSSISPVDRSGGGAAAPAHHRLSGTEQGEAVRGIVAAFERGERRLSTARNSSSSNSPPHGGGSLFPLDIVHSKRSSIQQLS